MTLANKSATLALIETASETCSAAKKLHLLVGAPDIDHIDVPFCQRVIHRPFSREQQIHNFSISQQLKLHRSIVTSSKLFLASSVSFDQLIKRAPDRTHQELVRVTTHHLGRKPQDLQIQLHRPVGHAKSTHRQQRFKDAAGWKLPARRSRHAHAKLTLSNALQ